MEKEAASRKTNKAHKSLSPTALTKGSNIEKEASSKKKEKNPSRPNPDGLN